MDKLDLEGGERNQTEKIERENTRRNWGRVSRESNNNQSEKVIVERKWVISQSEKCRVKMEKESQ